MNQKGAWRWVGLAVAATGLFRFLLVLQDPLFSRLDDIGLHWSEEAVQYRHARWIATTGGLPKIDLSAEYPDGLDVQHHITILMETTVGWSYRYLVPKRIPFHLFAAFFLCVFSCLSAAAVFSAVRTLWRDSLPAFAAMGFYLFNLSAAMPSITHSFVKQEFALPLFFAHLSFLLRAWQEKEIRHAVLSACFLYAALAAWHLTPFLFLIEMLILGGFALFGVTDPGSVRVLGCLCASALLGGLSLPTLKAQGFLASLPLMSAVAALSAAWVHNLWKGKLLRWMAWGLPFGTGIFLGARHAREFSHVYNWIQIRLLYIGHPPNPTELDWESAVMWAIPFVSPGWLPTWHLMGPLLIAGGLGFILRARQLSSWSKPEWFLAFLTLAFGSLYALTIRMGALFAYPLAIYAAGSLSYALDPALRSRTKKYAAAATLLFMTANAYGLLRWHRTTVRENPGSYFETHPGLHLDLLKAIRRIVPPGQPVLANFPLSPSILAYTGRPVLLHSKFETQGIRNRARRFEEALFRSEEEFWNFCRSLGARYFVYDTSMLLATDQESIRWRIHRLGGIQDSVAHAFQYRPESLRRFQWKWSSQTYQIFEALPPGQNSSPLQRPYFISYDPAYSEAQ